MSLQARYTILRKIADGGTAEIFLATQKGVHGFEKVVVLKRIFPAYYADPQFRDMLVNEAHIAMSFNHSNIVQVLDLGEDDGQYILALELVDGWTLDAVIRRVRGSRSSFPPALALYVTAEVCRALAYAHAKTDADGKPLGIVHRDISPHNVLLSEQGEVKLTDFGIATVKENNEGGEKVIRGKIAFMSPEQAAGGPLDARSDLFSVGTMLYVMICGRYPFDAPTDLEVLLLVKNGEAVPPEVARPGIHPEVVRLLKRALAKDPDQRFQRADDMLLEVEQVMRAAFRAVGQTELKRWLQDLSARDGVPSVTKVPALPSSTPAGRVVGPATPAGSNPIRIPPPPTVTRSGAATRPPPPPAALSVGRRMATNGSLPPRGRPPLHSTHPVADEDAPFLDAPTPLPEAVSGPIPLANDLSESQPSEITQPNATSPALPKAETETTATASLPPEGEASAVPRSTAASLSARLSMGRPTVPVPLPAFPQGPIVPPPPVSPEILAAAGASDTRPAAAATSAPPPAPPAPVPAQRRTIVWASAGIAALAIVIGSIKACGGHRNGENAVKQPAEAAPTVAARSTDKAAENAATAPATVPAVVPDAGATAVAEPAAKVATATAPDPGAGGAAAATAVATPDAAAPIAKTEEAKTPPGEEKAQPKPEEKSEAKPEELPRPPTDSPDAGEADAGSETKVKVSLSVTSVPPGARLTTAHHDYGTTPARIHLRAGNAYALTFKLDGYRPLTKHVDVTDEDGQELSVTLRKTGGSSAKDTPAPAPSAAPAPPPPPPPKPGKSWWQKMFSR